MFLSHNLPLHFSSLVLHLSFHFSPPLSLPTSHFVHPLLPYFPFTITILYLHLLSHLPNSNPSILFHFFFSPYFPLLFNFNLSTLLLLLFPLSLSPPATVAHNLSGRLAPPHLPTTSAALQCPTVPISPEGWASAAHSMLASSGVPGTSRAPPIPVGPHPHHYHTATARRGGHTVRPASSASSHLSLYAG